MREHCPRCGAEYNADTSEFIPVKAEDGTYEPTKDWVHHPQACVDFIGNQLATIDNELGGERIWISEQAPYQPCAVCGETEAWCGCEEAEGDQQ